MRDPARVPMQYGLRTHAQGCASAAGLLQSAFEARLAAGEAQIANGLTGAGRLTLKTLARDAKARGYELIARKATASAKA